MNSDDIPIGLIDGLGAATNNAIKKKLNIDVSSQTANLTLNNLQLTSQYLKVIVMVI
jgi:ribosomal protein S13